MKYPSIFKITGPLSLVMIGGLLLPLRAWGAAESSYIMHNGLKVILVEQPGSPVVSLRVMIKTGASDEASRSEFGLAHLMEHMAFKGCARHRDAGAITTLVERNGGEINAYTSSDATVYYLSLPSDQVLLGLDILSDLVFSPLYDPKEYELEKEVIIEEIKRSRDNPDQLLMEEYFRLAYPDHPYGRPIIGYEETVRKATVDEAKAFHTRHYRPDNAVLVITGGFISSTLSETIQRFFGNLEKPATPLARTLEPNLPPPTGPQVIITENDHATLAKVIIGFRGPSGSDAETPIMDLLSSILSGGKSSRLVEVVKDKKKLVTDISTYSHTPRYQGTFMISLETEPLKIILAITAVWEELKHLISAPAGDEEMQRARALAEKDFLASQESAQGLAAQITEFESIFDDWRLRDAYLPLWNRTRQTELIQSVARHFLPKNLTLVVMLPPQQPGKPNSDYPTPEQLISLANRLRPPAPQAGVNTAPAFQEIKLKVGPRLLVMRDATLPLVTIKAAALGGLLAETPEQNGLNNFMAAVWTKATKDKPAQALSRAAEDIGASITAFSGRNSTGLSASFLSTHLSEGLKLFTEVLTSPAFSNADVETVRPEILAEIKVQDEYLPGRVFRLLARRLYPDGHPYSREQLGTQETVSQLTAKDLRKSYKQLICPKNTIIAVAGDVDPQKIRENLERTLADWPQPDGCPPLSIPKTPSPLKKLTEVDEKLDRSQTHLALGFQAPGLGSPEAPALNVLTAYLSGMSGPLFRELRDQQSLAYTVQCSYNPGLGIGAFTFYIATDPQKVKAALAGFKDIIERIKKVPISTKDLEGAKRYLAGTTKIRLQTISSRASQIIMNSLYDLGLDYEERHLAAIVKVTAEDVQKVATKYLDQDRAVLAIIGKKTD
ncbi:MAG: insulinase family protein [Candidatus Adiutrix intracellularis]|nr:insulinase family protein [Candidatus Adiutrix intracellularis]